MISATISECMSKDFAVIRQTMLVAEASAALIKKEVLGGPVVDEAGKLLGWISEQECLQVILQVVYHNIRVATVQDVMQKEVVTVQLGADPLQVAEQMLAAKPKSYPVLNDDGKVVGVITRRHILKMLDDKLSEIVNK